MAMQDSKARNASPPRFALILVSSGRWLYLKKTINRLKAINLLGTEINSFLIVNCIQPSKRQSTVERLIGQFQNIDSVLVIEDNSHSGIVRSAMEIAQKYDYAIIIEEDWLLSNRLTPIKLMSFVESLGNYRQFVLSKYASNSGGFNIEDLYIKRYQAYFRSFGQLSSSLLAQKKMFSLNPMVVPKNVSQFLFTNFNWGANFSGYQLELELGRFLGTLYGPTIMGTSLPEFRVKHIGITSTTRFNRLRLKFGTSMLPIIVLVYDLVFSFYLKLPKILQNRIKLVAKRII